MKTFTCSFILLFLIFTSIAQTHSFSYLDWSDSTTYRISPAPLIKGNTVQSDSVATLMNAKEVFEHNGVYYFINSWADYYLWYVDKFPFEFDSPDLYKELYQTQNNYAMAKFVVNNFKGSYFPSRILVQMGKKKDDTDKFFEKWEKKIRNDDKRKNIYSKKSNEEEKQRYNSSGNTKISDTSTKK